MDLLYSFYNGNYPPENVLDWVGAKGVGFRGFGALGV